jgi:hypothetical protein
MTCKRGAHARLCASASVLANVGETVGSPGQAQPVSRPTSALSPMQIAPARIMRIVNA